MWYQSDFTYMKYCWNSGFSIFFLLFFLSKREKVRVCIEIHLISKSKQSCFRFKILKKNPLFKFYVMLCMPFFRVRVLLTWKMFAIFTLWQHNIGHITLFGSEIRVHLSPLCLLTVVFLYISKDTRETIHVQMKWKQCKFHKKLKLFTQFTTSCIFKLITLHKVLKLVVSLQPYTIEL